MKQCKEDDLLKSIVDSDDTSSSLQPRDAFYGGRTETFKLYTEASKGEKSNIMMSLPSTPMLTNWQNTFGTPRDHSRKCRGFNEM